LLVDGPPSGLTTALAERLGRAAAEAARLQGGSIFGLLSPKLSNSVTSALGAALGRSHLAVLERGDDPYLAHLELADAFIVTGDAEWILADVCSTGKPVDIFPLSEPLGLLERLRGAVVRLADSSPTNNRGTARPQKGLERFCSRLIANGTVRPPKNRRALHDALVARGCARRLGDRALDPEFRPLREAERAAGQVQSLLGIG
jgi:mitochondrial fission protein ELM1